MQYRVLPKDFVVEEVIRLPRSGRGGYTLYRVRKIGRTTLEVQASLARALDRSRSEVHFPALKDRLAVAWQHASVQGDGPKQLRGQGWSAQRIGYARRPLRSSDLRGNRFTVILRDLAPVEMPVISARLTALGRCGLPNYFDEQRFGSYSPGQEWTGKLILRRDAEGALRAHLGQPMAGDPPGVLAFKAQVREHWGEWGSLLEIAPRPSNFRSVLVFLRDHPEDYRRALNLVTPRVLSLYLAAYQSLFWNRVVGQLLRRQLESPAEIEIAGERLPLYVDLPDNLLVSWREAVIPLLHHRAVLPDSMSVLARQVLAEEGLQLQDLKARILRRAYLGKGERSLLLFPEEAAVLEETVDERFPGRQRVTVRFTLPPGAYATLVLKVIAGALC